jgi:murein L,D-transpeptidase YcbB/YkuD
LAQSDRHHGGVWAGNRAAVYRHAHAFGLYDKRQKNIRAALEHIIEKGSEVEVTAPAVVAAIQAYAKINSRGLWIERTQTVDLNKLFAEMTAAELEAYAQKGILPEWFEDTISSQQADAIGGSDDQVE